MSRLDIRQAVVYYLLNRMHKEIWMASELHPEISSYFKKLGSQGGAVRNPKKREAAQKNVAKARQSRWKPRLLKKEDSND